MRYKMMAALAATVLWCGAAQAEDAEPCARGMVCASDPQTVVAALQQAGLQAKLGTDETGDPMVESAAAGYNFTIFFYGCNAGAKCDSLQFRVNFKPDATNTLGQANRWNAAKRFLTLSVAENQGMAAFHDVTTVGGVNAANFQDVLVWWNTMLGQLSTFFKEDAAAHPNG